MNNYIFLTNNLSNKKEKFVPIDEKEIGMYVCGPTVYDNPHIGNARTLVVFDILFRILKCRYGSTSVNYIRNITDVDDKIIETSKIKGISIDKITSDVKKNFHKNAKDLNCLEPTSEPKATEHIKEMIEMIESLIVKKLAYVNNGHIYFMISKFKSYGKLSNKKLARWDTSFNLSLLQVFTHKILQFLNLLKNIKPKV